MYLNDNDPYCAAWLRNLFPGATIDERPIEQLEPPTDPRAHFFAGIGGWEYALQLAGWPADRPVWTGSCPCQPFSVAGKRQGTSDPRHLWPEFLRLIGISRPPTIFGEQVASKAGRAWLAAVRTDLEALGYAVGCADLCAAGVGSPHIRQRLFWGATHPICRRWERQWVASPPAWREEQFAGLLQDQIQHALPTGRDRALVDGVSPRTPILRAYGNAIVPQVAAAFIAAFLDAERELSAAQAE